MNGLSNKAIGDFYSKSRLTREYLNDWTKNLSKISLRMTRDSERSLEDCYDQQEVQIPLIVLSPSPCFVNFY